MFHGKFLYWYLYNIDHHFAELIILIISIFRSLYCLWMFILYMKIKNKLWKLLQKTRRKLLVFTLLECVRIFYCTLLAILFKILNLKGSKCSELDLRRGYLLTNNTFSGFLWGIVPLHLFPPKTNDLLVVGDMTELWTINFEFYGLYKQIK